MLLLPLKRTRATYNNTGACSMSMSSPDDAKLVKVAAPTLRSKRFLEGDDHAGNVVSIPYRAENSVPKPGTWHTRGIDLCLRLSLHSVI